MYERVIGIGDIHGCFKLLTKLVEEVIRFNPDTDRLVFLGDYMDRGPNGLEVVEYVFGELMEKHPDNIVALMGNHEEVFLRLPESREFWLKNGGDQTLANAVRFGGQIEKYLPTIKKVFSEQTRFYHEEEEAVFVHAGLQDGGVGATKPHDMMNLRNFKTYQGPLVVCGHTPHTSARRYPHAIVIDSGAFHTGKLSAYDIKQKVLYTTNGIEELRTFTPDEPGDSDEPAAAPASPETGVISPPG